jgi:predicted nucleotidyltransferase
MIKLPEKIRRPLEKIVKEMRIKENIYGVGLFASWSRGDATKSSDVDLLVLDKGDFSHEFVERIEINGLLIDLDHIPKAWIHGQIPPELDQKLNEMQILYDRDWSLTNTKLSMAKSYGSPEKVDIRTEAHVVESDIYLSRATSAFSRKDFQSAHLFAAMGLENVLRVLMEVTLEPFSNSRFIEKLEESTAKLGMQNLFTEYLKISGLNEVDNVSVEDKLKLFKIIWDEINFTAKQNPRAFESSHFIVKTKLKYYLNPAFLQGMIIRTKSLINSGKAVEATHYLNNMFVDMIENYAWVKSSIGKVKLDYTTLMRSLESLEEKNPRNYTHMIEFLNLSDIPKLGTAETIEKTRKIMVKIRRERKVLIKTFRCGDVSRKPPFFLS